MKTRWQTFKDFIRTKETGYIFTRKELHRVLHDEQEQKEKWSGVPHSTIAMCVRNLMYGKFIEWAGRGKYKLLAQPPTELAVGDCLLLAKGDNLSYVEKLHERKERLKRRKTNE